MVGHAFWEEHSLHVCTMKALLEQKASPVTWCRSGAHLTSSESALVHSDTMSTEQAVTCKKIEVLHTVKSPCSIRLANARLVTACCEAVQ